MNTEPRPPTRKGPAELFTGDAYIDAIHVRKPEPSRMACSYVHFTPGARTAWHSHALGQTLYITEGTAVVGTRDGKVIVARAGARLSTLRQVKSTGMAPPPAPSWRTSPFSKAHRNGEGVTWLEHVTDDQYRAAGVAAETR